MPRTSLGVTRKPLARAQTPVWAHPPAWDPWAGSQAQLGEQEARPGVLGSEGPKASVSLYLDFFVSGMPLIGFLGGPQRRRGGMKTLLWLFPFNQQNT